MRRVACLLLALAFLAPPAVSRAEGLPALNYPPLKFNIPKPQRVELKNGMVLYLLEDHEIPLVEVTGLVRIGSAYAPKEKAGLAELTGHLWRSGGTKGMRPDDLDQKLEHMGASVETSIGMDSGTVGMKVMSRDVDEGFRLFADVITNPAFDEGRFTVLKQQMIEGIRRELDDPDSLVDREFHKLLFKGHPFGVFPTVGTVEAVSLQDCKDFYYRHVGPESFIIGVSGDFDPADVQRRFETLFAGFPRAGEKLGAIPPVEEKKTEGVYLIDRKLTQTAIRFGHIGISRSDPDYYDARVMNYVLGGGGFSSRLMKEVRSVRGLAYSVWSYFTGGDATKGAFMVGGETKSATTGEFIEVSRDIIREMVQKGGTVEEVEFAKEAIINSFIFGFDKNMDVLGRYLWMEYYGMQKNYLEAFRANIQAVTAKTALESAKRRLHPDSLLVVAVGDKSVIGPALEKFGAVNLIEPEK